MQNGDIYAYGIGGYDGTNATDSAAKTLKAVVDELIEKMNDAVRKVVETAESDITLAANTITRLTGTSLTSLSVSIPTEAFTDGQEYVLEYSKSCLSESCTISFDSTIK